MYFLTQQACMVISVLDFYPKMFWVVPELLNILTFFVVLFSLPWQTLWQYSEIDLECISFSLPFMPSHLVLYNLCIWSSIIKETRNQLNNHSPDIFLCLILQFAGTELSFESVCSILHITPYFQSIPPWDSWQYGKNILSEASSLVFV